MDPTNKWNEPKRWREWPRGGKAAGDGHMWKKPRSPLTDCKWPSALPAASRTPGQPEASVPAPPRVEGPGFPLSPLHTLFSSHQPRVPQGPGSPGGQGLSFPSLPAQSSVPGTQPTADLLNEGRMQENTVS